MPRAKGPTAKQEELEEYLARTVHFPVSCILHMSGKLNSVTQNHVTKSDQKR